MTRAISGAARWLLAWLITSYAFAAYMVLLGTLNEQFFVYILPAAIVGTVMAADAALTRLRNVRARAVIGLGAAAVVLATSITGWVRLYLTDNAAIFAITGMVRDTLPDCATFSVTGDADRFSYLLPGTTVVMFATGEGAQAHGVHLFVLSDKDVTSGYGDATVELTRWVRAHGTLIGGHDTFTYDGLEVWRTPSTRTRRSPTPSRSRAVTSSSPTPTGAAASRSRRSRGRIRRRGGRAGRQADRRRARLRNFPTAPGAAPRRSSPAPCSPRPATRPRPSSRSCPSSPAAPTPPTGPPTCHRSPRPIPPPC